MVRIASKQPRRRSSASVASRFQVSISFSGLKAFKMASQGRPKVDRVSGWEDSRFSKIEAKFDAAIVFTSGFADPKITEEYSS